MRTRTALDQTARASGARGAWLRVLATALLVLWAAPALATGGSYATAGTGTYSQSLWWLDFTGYNPASLTTQTESFTLPTGAGTVSIGTTVSSTAMTLVAEPSWAGGGAFGHGAYNGLTGKPIFYWLGQAGSATTTLSAITVKDASGNARTFVLYAADGENTNAGETIVYGSTANWSLIDSITYYANYNGVPPTLTGLGTTSVTESATSNANYMGGVVLGTSNPTQVTATYTGNEATLYAISLPPITYNLTIASRINAADQFTISMGYTSPAVNLKSATTAGAATTATTGAISVIGTNSITLSVAMAAGSVSPITAYTGSMICTNAGPGAATWGGTNTVLPSGDNTQFTLTPQTGDSITCTLTVTPVSQTVSGTVYSDANHNGNLDGSETGTGVAGLYVKLATYTGGACKSPATAAAAVTAATGAYSLSGLAAGSYCLILSTNNTLANVTPALPAGWIGTQNASGIIQFNVVANALPPPENFGLYNGSSVSGTVFGDIGVGGGTANNGIQDGSEAGISGIAVQTSGATATTASTASNGTYTLFIPASAAGALTVTPSAPGGYLATGGGAGTTGGTYTRPSVTFTPAAGTVYSGVTFGLVPPNTLTPNGAQHAQPGAMVSYAHAFVAGSGGQVTVSLAGSSTPSVPAWTQVLYRDTACSGTISNADAIVSGPITVTVGQTVCLLVQVQVPEASTPGAQSAITVSAAFQYTNANPALSATVTASDVTTVGSPGTLTLMKLVSDVTQGTGNATSVNAKPGDTLQYTLTATNTGSQTLSTLVIYDSTPAFTGFVSTACPGTLPAGMTSCTVTTQPAPGASGSVQWTFTGTLGSGATIIVTYQVKVSS
ncbi:MAG TPA: SdrD B-like domain-containing protein [Steroidobacteraceae bacterium]|nr:SdrD B-like domain-containing protein [Steroidobacteraceae bacterium]